MTVIHASELPNPYPPPGENPPPMQEPPNLTR